MEIRNIFLLVVALFTWNSLIVESLQDNSYISSSHSLKNQHLVVAGPLLLTQFNIVRNASGHILNVKGIAPEMLSWLSQSYKFTYSYLQINDTPLDTIRGIRGLVSYVDQRECDVLISVSVTASRLGILDFTHPFSYLLMNYLILRPESPINVGFVAQPFTYSTWILLCLTVVVLLLVIKMFNWHVSAHLFGKNPGDILKDATMYIISIILYQSKSCTSKNLMIRIIIMSWCIASFALTNFYSALLISFVTSPTLNPLINSIYDIPNRPDVRVTMNRGLNIEAVLLSSDYGLFKQLGDKLRNYPAGRCNLTSQCLDLVKSGGHAYIAGSATYLADAIKTEFFEKRKCTMQLGKESFLNLPIPWVMRKGDRRIFDLNNGITRMREAGLLKYWENFFQADVSQCLRKQEPPIEPLTLKSLTGAFIILLIGFVLSLSIFTGEIFFHQFRHRE